MHAKLIIFLSVLFANSKYLSLNLCTSCDRFWTY